MKNHTSSQSGFSAVELMVALFIGAVFLLSGYQLYTFILKRGSDSADTAQASNVAYQYLQTVSNGINPAAPCSASTPYNNVPITVVGLNNESVTVTITCPYSSATDATKNVSLVTSTVSYKGIDNQEAVTHAIFTQ